MAELLRQGQITPEQAAQSPGAMFLAVPSVRRRPERGRTARAHGDGEQRGVQPRRAVRGHGE
jgi:hypothetical protein